MSQTKPIEMKIDLTADTARWLLDTVSPFVADRPLIKSHVNKLASEMQNGHFLPDITTIMVAKLGDKAYRMNGQHTATAILQCCEANPDFSVDGVTLLTFTVSDEAELRKLYARIDRGSTRTNSQVTNSLLAGTANFVDVSARVLNLLPIGLAFRLHEDQVKRRLYGGENAALDVQGDYLELSKQVAAFMGGLDHRTGHHGHLFRGPVVGALYATFAIDSEDTERFWRAVATGVGIESEAEPAARLRQLLQNSSLGGGSIFRGTKPLMGAEEAYRVCLHAWNRFRAGDIFKGTLRPTKLKSRPEVK